MQSPTDGVETGYGVLRTVEWDVLVSEMAVRGDLRRVAQTTRGTRGPLSWRPSITRIQISKITAATKGA